MKNPWEEIPLTDYENHMKLDSVRQLQTMNEMMQGQFDAYPVSSVMILGIAGGNGLEHIQKRKFERVYVSICETVRINCPERIWSLQTCLLNISAMNAFRM